MNADILGIVFDHLCNLGDPYTALNVMSINRNTYKTLQTKRDVVLRKCRFQAARQRIQELLTDWPSLTHYANRNYSEATRWLYKNGVYIKLVRQVYGRDCCFEHMVMLFGEVSLKIISNMHYLVLARRGMEYNINTGEKAETTLDWNRTDDELPIFANIQQDMDARASSVMRQIWRYLCLRR